MGSATSLWWSTVARAITRARGRPATARGCSMRISPVMRAHFRGAGGDPVKGVPRGVQYQGRPFYLFPAPTARLPGPPGAFWGRPRQTLVQALEAAQFAGAGRLRRARVLQPDPAAALLAAFAPSPHHFVGARRRIDAAIRMRLAHDRPEPDPLIGP